MSLENWKANELFTLLLEKFDLPVKESIGSAQDLTDYSAQFKNLNFSQPPSSTTSPGGDSSFSQNVNKDYQENLQSLSWNDKLSVSDNFTGNDEGFEQNIDNFMNSIARKESGKLGYRATGIPVYDNKTKKYKGRALGKYQIMDYNWTKWAKEAGLPKAAQDPKVGMTPANQEYVAKYKFNEYYKRFNGDWQAVATAWYAGPSNIKSKMKNTKTVKHTGFDYDFPSTADYGKDIVRGMKK